MSALAIGLSVNLLPNQPRIFLTAQPEIKAKAISPAEL